MAFLDKNVRWVSLILLIYCAGIARILYRILQPLDFDMFGPDAIISICLLALGAWLLLLAVKAYPTRVGLQMYAFVVAIALAVFLCVTDIALLRWWADNTQAAYEDWIIENGLIRFFTLLTCYGWIASLAALQKSKLTLEKTFNLQEDAAKLLREAELFKLRQQLQPHFLYNSLNSINALIMIQPDKAQEMVGLLSDFMRSSVKRESTDAISIAEELEYIQSYLSIEAVRFGDRLRVDFTKDDTDSAMIPPFLLQPVIENAIKFGLYGKTGEVAIKMNIRLHEGMLTITVTNPFDASMKPPSGTGFGLEGIGRRLYLLYARTDLLETKEEENLFTTILKIPQPHV